VTRFTPGAAAAAALSAEFAALAICLDAPEGASSFAADDAGLAAAAAAVVVVVVVVGCTDGSGADANCAADADAGSKERPAVEACDLDTCRLALFAAPATNCCRGGGGGDGEGDGVDTVANVAPVALASTWFRLCMIVASSQSVVTSAFGKPSQKNNIITRFDV
jgi:hypothetical protein